jgi:WD40 repeat protein
VVLLNLKTNQRTQLSSDENKPYNMPDKGTFSPDGKSLLIHDGYDGRSYQWDVQTGKEILYDASPKITLQQAFYSPDGSKILTYGSDNLIVLDTISGQTLLTIPDTEPDSKVQFFPNSQTIMVYTRLFGETKSRLELWDVVSGQKVSSIPLDFKTAWSKDHFRISPDGQSIAFTDTYTNEVQIWELHDLQNPGPQHIFPNGLAIKRGRTGVYANMGSTLAVSLDNLFELTNIATDKKFRASVTDNIVNLALADDGKLVIVAELNSISSRGQITLWSWDGVKAEKLRTLA